MGYRLDDFTVGEDVSCLAALAKIDANRRGFVVVVDGAGRAVGTLTDGDIRRAVLAAAAPDAGAISAGGAACPDFASVPHTVRADDLVEAFRESGKEFLPIVAGDGTLVSVVTRGQLYGLVLQCLDLPDLDRLLDVDDSLADYEVFKRPWGIYKTTVLQPRYQAKVIQVKPGGCLSLQYHLRREEHWVVASGSGEVQIGDSVVPAHPGSTFFIPKGCKHRMRNTSETEQLIVTEVQIGDYFGEDDIIRIEDEYGRAGSLEGQFHDVEA